MTIDRSYTDVTFWEVKNHKHYTLRGRIKKEEKELMEWYLCPVLTDEEKKAFQDEREFAKATMMTLGNETDLSHHSIKGGGMLEEDDDEDDDEEKDSDIEKSDSSFADRIDNIIHYNDIDQNLKGDNINYIGQIAGLSKEK